MRGKIGVKLIVSFVLVLVLMSFVSAGIFDFLTGNTIADGGECQASKVAGSISNYDKCSSDQRIGDFSVLLQDGGVSIKNKDGSISPVLKEGEFYLYKGDPEYLFRITQLRDATVDLFITEIDNLGIASNGEDETSGNLVLFRKFDGGVDGERTDWDVIYSDGKVQFKFPEYNAESTWLEEDEEWSFLTKDGTVTIETNIIVKDIGVFFIFRVDEGETNDRDDSSVISCDNGCLVKDKCLPYGYRKVGDFCSEDNIMLSQQEAETACDNNFECGSNLCVDSTCVEAGLWQKIMNWFSRLF